MAEPTPHHDAEQEQMQKLVSGGSLPSAFLFGALALAAAFILAPVLDNGTQRVANLTSSEPSNGIDTTITGSIASQSDPALGNENGTIRYTIRRSVIQKNPSDPCYIYADGTRRGDC